MKQNNTKLIISEFEKEVLKKSFEIISQRENIEKRELIDLISQSIKSSKENIRKAIDNNISFFITYGSLGRGTILCLNIKTLKRLLNLIDVKANLSNIKKQLALKLMNMNDDAKFEIRVLTKDRTLIVYTTPMTISNRLWVMPDEEAKEVLDQLNAIENSPSI
ncbi:MAG: hypothetical protein QXL14_03570 [Candidatus Aenigmatarchaeota archaeon]